MVVVPGVILAAAELALRLSGYGHPAGYFLKREIGGEVVLTENPHFGFSFFPPGLARSPLPTVLSPKKKEGTYRIFLFGESAALGDPRPAYGFGRYLQVLLNDRFASNRFEVVCVAMTAINSHAVLPIARECAAQNGDLWVIYMGNNEMIGPFGAVGKLGASAPPARVVRANLAIQRLRIGQALEALIRKWRDSGEGAVWRGLNLFTGHEVAPDSPARERVQLNFRRNLEHILEQAEDAGARVIMCTMGSSLKDCAPHASLHSMSFPKERAAEWATFYKAGAVALQSGDYPEAKSKLSKANGLDPLFAEARFRLALAHLSETNRDEALKEFVAAKDLDALPFRTTSPLNEIIRATVARSESEKVVLLDVERSLNEDLEIPGQNVFFDHVHYNFEGNYWLAREVAETIFEQLPAELKSADRGAWAEQDFCEHKLGLTHWNKSLALEQMLSRISGAPYTNQLTNTGQRKVLVEQIRALREQARNAGPRAAEEVYLQALKGAPDDHYLHQNYAEFLELSGRRADAIKQWEQVQKLVPHHPAAHFHAGRLKLQIRNFTGAEQDLRRALEIRRDFPEGLTELGRALAGQKRHEEARKHIHEGLRIHPANAAAHFALAESLGAEGRRGEAVEHLKQAVAFDPGHWEAHYFLGVELAVGSDLEGALRHFEETVKLRPGYVPGHLNYGVALAKKGRLNEAAAQFEAVLERDPENRPARAHLETIQSALRERSMDL